MKKEITCFFTGHRDIPDEICLDLYNQLCDVIYSLYQEGCRNFVTGGAIGFDTLAAAAVLHMRCKHKDIKLHICIPCRDQPKYFPDGMKGAYQDLLMCASSHEVLSEHYYRGCMQARNRKMADMSSYCVAYCRKEKGGTAYTVNYAEKKGVKIIHL